MDNRVIKFGEAKVARDLTKEIDQETDMAMGAGAENMRFGNIGGVVVPEQAGRGRDLARRVGWQVVDGGLHEVADIETAGELSRDQTEVENPELIVGEDTAVQRAEYLAEDREDLQRELGEGLKFEAKVAARSQEAVARAVMPQVEKMVSSKSFRPSDLERVYRQGVNSMLVDVLGRSVGERN